MTALRKLSQMPISIQNDSSLAEAISRLIKGSISRLIVEGGPETRIITEKDIGLFLLLNESEQTLEKISISNIAKKLLSIDEKKTIQDAAKIMIDEKIGSLGINSNDKLVGIITKTDLIKNYFEHFVGHFRVGDFMTIEYASMSLDDSLNEVVLKMMNEKISRIFLKNQNDEIEGILTFQDLFQVALDQGNKSDVVDNTDPVISLVFPRKGFLSESGFGKSTLAKDVMSKNIVTVDYNDDLVTACQEMIENKINGVGVNVDGKLSGVISKTDIVKAITKLN